MWRKKKDKYGFPWKDIKGKKLERHTEPERKAGRCIISIKVGEWNNAV
jgi:hypothetical protein